MPAMEIIVFVSGPPAFQNHRTRVKRAGTARLHEKRETRVNRRAFELAAKGLLR